MAGLLHRGQRGFPVTARGIGNLVHVVAALRAIHEHDFGALALGAGAEFLERGEDLPAHRCADADDDDLAVGIRLAVLIERLDGGAHAAQCLRVIAVRGVLSVRIEPAGEALIGLIAQSVERDEAGGRSLQVSDNREKRGEQDEFVHGSVFVEMPPGGDWLRLNAANNE